MQSDSILQSAYTDLQQTKFTDKPDVADIPAMLRRRLNLLGRASASQVAQLLDEDDSAAIVYCSRHGDIERTLAVLQDIAAREAVSPMNFSLTVHNAIAGVISINKKITSCVSSLASGDEGLVPSLLEAVGLLSDQCRRVVCVHSDVPIPDIYQARVDAPRVPFACCFVVTANEGQALSLEYVDGSPPSGPLPDPVLFVEFLGSDTAAITIRHNGGCWQISKH